MPGTTYEASLEFSTRDAPGIWAVSDLPDIVWHLKAKIQDTVGDSGESEAPAAVRIAGSSPNPFHEVTVIRFEIPQKAWTTVTVHDAQGSRVSKIVDRELSAGTHEVTWNGRTAAGRSVPAGTYFIQLSSGGASSCRKIIRLH